MTSSSIMNEMYDCQAQIDTLLSDIASVQMTVEEQEMALRKYENISDQYLSELNETVAKVNNITAYYPTVVLSVRVQEKTDVDMSKAQLSRITELVWDVKDRMVREIQDNSFLIQQKKREITTCEIKMNQLKQSYNQTLAEEDAARQPGQGRRGN